MLSLVLRFTAFSHGIYSSHQVDSRPSYIQTDLKTEEHTVVEELECVYLFKLPLVLDATGRCCLISCRLVPGMILLWKRVGRWPITSLSPWQLSLWCVELQNQKHQLELDLLELEDQLVLVV